MTTTAHDGYVDVDAAILALGRLEAFADHQVRTVDDLDKVYSDSPAAERHGVIKWLLAAFGSARSRGAVEYTATPLGRPELEESGVGEIRTRRVRLVVESGGGVSQPYRMVTTVTVTEDDWGVPGWGAARGIAQVSGRKGDTTLFGGHAVGRMIADLWMSDGLARKQISRWCATPAPRVPAWRSQALRALAEIANESEDAGDASGQAWLCRYMAGYFPGVSPDGVTAAEVLASLCELLTYGKPAAAWHAWCHWRADPTGNLGEALRRSGGLALTEGRVLADALIDAAAAVN